MNPVEIIHRKRLGQALTAGEIDAFCAGFVSGRIPDYQVSAWLMAVCLSGMTEAETLALTRAMVRSGETLDWSHLPRPAVDKHSTGGVGDKTSLVLVPLMAAAGLPFVKMAGRGLGHTGGTIDKLESIPGFRTDLSPHEMRAQVERIGCALVRQGPGLVPADRQLYALRDVTGTVDCVPLIASSVMSKKLAAGAPLLVLDVKWGAGAFMATKEEARELARALLAIGTGAGRKVRALLTPMEEPLGRAVGNALEVREAIATLRGRGPDGLEGRGGPTDLRELVLRLGVQLLLLAEEAADAAEARARLAGLLDSGAALARLRSLIEAQGGDARVVDAPDRLPEATRVSVIEAGRAGWVERVDARGIAEAALLLGAGRRRKEDAVDPSVGVRLLAKSGARVERGTPLAEVHAGGGVAAGGRSSGAAVEAEREARARVAAAFRFSERETPPLPLDPEIME